MKNKPSIGRFAAPSLLLSFLFLSAACDNPATGEGEGEGDASEGEGDAGEGEGDAGEGEGEGVLVGEVYSGAAENGVSCADATCDVGRACCAAFGGGAEPSCSADPGMCPGAMTATILCDGPEDCTDAASPVCCGGLQFSGTACVAASVCTGQSALLCVTNTDCPANADCCGGGPLTMLGADAGVCIPAAPNGDRCRPMMP
jgi:hypothetical protein